jgi:hypothetical protein
VKFHNSVRTALLAFASCLVIDCGGSPVAPSEPPARASVGEPSSPSTPETRPVFSNCRLGSFRFASAGHDENTTGGSRRSGTSEPSCAINADCIAQQGKTTPGDGTVVMECERGECSCRLEALVPPNAVVEFHFAATCSSPDVMQQLMREHCLIGMDVHTPSQ